MPAPHSSAVQSGSLLLSPVFRITLTGERDPVLQRATERLTARLKLLGAAPAPDNASGALIEIHCDSPMKVVLELRDDESYALSVNSRRAKLQAPNPLGIIRGMETLLQLIETGPGGISVRAVTIQDQPRFPWRGLMIDVVRHFMPLEAILRQLDGMAAAKFNVFHWHLSDDQGFRVESKLYPKLHQLGSDGRFYTQDQIRQVIVYARDRGIRVVPEFDVPGHTTSWLVGYPELASGPGPFRIARAWNVIVPAMNPASEEVYRFLNGFFGEMAALFPDRYVHIGGDEVNGKQWSSNPRIQQFIREKRLVNKEGLQAWFNRRLQEIVSRHGKTMIGWDEVLHPELPASLTIQSWRGARSIAHAARNGHDALLSAGYYLDLMQSAAFHHSHDPHAGEAARMPADARNHILGGEACLWSEYVSAGNLDMRIWPRAAAVAERLWSPETATDPVSMYARLEKFSEHLDRLGLQHESSRREMVRKLAGPSSPEPLAIFQSALEPVKMYARSTTRPYTTSTPLNRLVDATPPESDSARKFGALVDSALNGSSASLQQAREQLVRWHRNYELLLPLLHSSELLRETLPLAEYVRDLASAGVESLGFLNSRNAPPPEWITRTRQLIASEGKQAPTAATRLHCASILLQYGRSRSRVKTQCAEPRYAAELMPAILDPVGKLVEAASALPIH